MLSQVVVALVHFQTPDLLSAAVSSFRSVYPDVALRIVDNGSADHSRDVIKALDEADRNMTVTLLDENRYHGPAMDLVLRDSSRELVFFLDTDTVTRKGGFLESMVALFEDASVFAAGQVVKADARGFASEEGTPVPASAFMMVRRSHYLTLPPFIHHGLPVLEACQAAADRGLIVAPYPIEQYVDHLGRGTAERFGYGLGLKSRLAYLLHKIGL